MKIEINNQRIVAYRKTTEFEITVTNKKGDDMELVISKWVIDDEHDTDNGMDILNDKYAQIETKVVEDFLGDEDDYEKFNEEIDNLSE